MKFRIDLCGMSKEVDSMFDLLTIWKELVLVGTRESAITTYELSGEYEWERIDARQIFDDMRRLFYGDE